VIPNDADRGTSRGRAANQVLLGRGRVAAPDAKSRPLAKTLATGRDQTLTRLPVDRHPASVRLPSTYPSARACLRHIDRSEVNAICPSRTRAERRRDAVVVSVHMLGGTSDPAGYYLSRQANCPADYYLGAEPVGRWLGSGAAAAGHCGSIDSAGARALRGYLAGRSPDDKILVPTLVRADRRGRLDAKPLVDAVRNLAEQLGVPPMTVFSESTARAMWIGLDARVGGASRGRRPTASPTRARRLAEAADLDVREVYRAADGSDRYAAAARFAGKRVDTRRPGIDVAVSAPKSVSVLFGLGDATTAAAVRDAHRTAVGEALAYLEALAGHGLRGHQGDGQRAEHIQTDGWIVATFEHRTSRSGDPQLHTHLVVPNLLHGVDGKWSAIDSKAVYRNALTASYIYQAVPRGELTQRLGVGWVAR
jgi:hypothetical protein